MKQLTGSTGTRPIERGIEREREREGEREVIHCKWINMY